MSPIITMVNNPFYSLSPLVIHFKWKAGNLEREETERALPWITEAVGRKEDSFSFLAPTGIKMDPYYCTDDKHTEERIFE